MSFGWAVAICARGGWLPTRDNVRGLNAWSDCEGGAKYNNPLNTSLRTSAVVGTQPGVSIPIYRTPVDGVEATVRTLKGGYRNATSALAAGRLGSALKSNAASVFTRGDGLHWGTDPACVERVLGGRVSAPQGGGGIAGSQAQGNSVTDTIGGVAAFTGLSIGGILLVGGVVAIGVVGFYLYRAQKVAGVVNRRA